MTHLISSTYHIWLPIILDLYYNFISSNYSKRTSARVVSRANAEVRRPMSTLNKEVLPSQAFSKPPAMAQPNSSSCRRARSFRVQKLSDEITLDFLGKNLRSYAKGWALLVGYIYVYIYMLHFNTPLNSQKLRLQGFQSQTKKVLPPSGQFTINLLPQTQSNLELTPPRIKQNIIFLYLHFYCSSQFRSRVFGSQIINLKFVHYLGGFY